MLRLQFAVVGDGRAHSHVGGSNWRDAKGNQLRCVNQQTRRDSFFQSMSAQVADLLANQHEVASGAFVHPTFTRDDFSLQIRRRIIEINRDKTLPCRLFQIFEDGLVTGIVGNNQHEIRRARREWCRASRSANDVDDQSADG